MKKITLVEGIGVAVLAVLISLAAGFVIRYFFGWDTVFKTNASLLTIAYLVYLIRKSRFRAGKVALSIGCPVILLAAVYFFKTAEGLLAFETGMVWIVRTILHHSGVLAASADLVLCLISSALAGWAFTAVDSMTAGVWCYFLAQSLWVLIPGSPASKRHAPEKGTDRCRFNRAYESAEEALRMLIKESF